MRKSLLLFLILLSIPLFSHKIELYNGKLIDTEYLIMKNDSVYTDNLVFSRNEVKSIIFGKGDLEIGEEEISADIKNILEQRMRLIMLYSDFPGVVMLDKGENRLFPDGLRSYRYHFRGLILKDSKRTWASFQRYFNPDMERIKIEMARVIKPDGSIIPLDMSTVKITKPRQGKVFFGKGKIISFTLPGVEVGDIVEYVYTEEIFNPWNKDIFSQRWYFGGSEPVLSSSVKLIIPPEEKILFKLRNTEDVMVDSLSLDSVRTYTFSTSNTIPPVYEPLMPSIQSLIPSLHLSNQEDWNYLFEWYSDFQKKRMVVTPEIQNLVDSLTSGLENEDEKVASIYHWVQRNVRYISIKGAVSSGVSGHKASVTLENGYGDCIDISILFSTMLKAVGVEAYPVYTHMHPSPGLLKEIPSTWGNHAIVEIFPEDDEPYFLDAVSNYSRYPSFPQVDHGVDAICAQKSIIDFIDVPPPERNRRRYQYIVELNIDGSSTLGFHSDYNGSYESNIRAYWERLNPEEKIRQFQQMAKRTSPEAILIDYSLENLDEISKPLVMNIEYSVPDMLKKAGDLYLLELPGVIERHTRGELSLIERRYDLVYDTSEEIVHIIRIVLGENWEVEITPEPLEIKKEHYEYTGGYKIEGDTLSFRDDWRRSGRRVSVGDYTEYRDTNREILNYVKKPVIIKRRGGGK